jgi:hypothetical protein
MGGWLTNPAVCNAAGITFSLRIKRTSKGGRIIWKGK